MSTMTRSTLARKDLNLHKLIQRQSPDSARSAQVAQPSPIADITAQAFLPLDYKNLARPTGYGHSTRMPGRLSQKLQRAKDAREAIDNLLIKLRRLPEDSAQAALRVLAETLDDDAVWRELGRHFVRMPQL